MTADYLERLLNEPESDRLDFKREWYDLSTSKGKATLARDVLAMANSLTEGEKAHIIFGVSDPSAGTQIIGVPETPTSEAINQILATHTNPVPRVRLYTHRLGERSLDILTIAWDNYHPYYATRHSPPVLSPEVVYVRRGDTVGRLRPRELEDLIRAKDARLGKQMSGVSPLQVGFVELPPSGMRGTIAVRVSNLTEEPIDGIEAYVDFILVGRPPVMHRARLINNLVLDPGGSREFSARIRSTFFNLEGEKITHSDVAGRWIDVRLALIYRDRDGFFRQVVRKLSLEC